MKTSVVIPAYNHWDLTHQLLWDIYKTCGKLHEVIIVDDASAEDFTDGLYWWTNAGMLRDFIVLRNGGNRGFLLSANRGLKQATGDAVILISTDVKVHKNIARMIGDILSENPKTLISGKVYRESTGWNKFDGKDAFPLVFPYAEGFLLATTKTGWEELGYFDERYAPNDFEDVDLSTTALSKGFELAELPPESVHHMSAQTIAYGAEREKLTKINQKKFEEKWIKTKK